MFEFEIGVESLKKKSKKEKKRFSLRLGRISPVSAHSSHRATHFVFPFLYVMCHWWAGPGCQSSNCPARPRGSITVTAS
jgi:hypothetical protein